MPKYLLEGVDVLTFLPYLVPQWNSPLSRPVFKDRLFTFLNSSTI